MKVKITMFSDFKLKCYNDAEENGTEVRLSGLGKELQNLIQLLIVNRTKHMQKDALTDVLYADTGYSAAVAYRKGYIVGHFPVELFAYLEGYSLFAF